VRKLLAGVAIGLGAAGLVVLVAWPGWLDKAELQTYDWRTRMLVHTRSWQGQPLVRPDIVLVEITDASIRDLSEFVGRWPWPRALQAMLVDYISRGQPRVVALDFTFLEPERPPNQEAKYQFLDRGEITSAQSDQELAGAVGRAGNVIVLADAVDAGIDDGVLIQKPWPSLPYGLGPAIEERPVVTPPYAALTAAAAGLAHNFIALDPDGVARRFPPFIRQGDRYLPSLGVAAALAGGSFRPDEVVLEGDGIRVRDRRIPLVPVKVAGVQRTDASGGVTSTSHLQQTKLINYRAPRLVDGAQPYVSYEAGLLLKSSDQLAIGEKPDIPPDVFKDKIVFVGIAFSGLVDVFQTPFGGGSMRGIQLHASVADSLLSDRFLRPASGWTAAAVTFGGALLIGLLSAGLPFWVAAASAAAFVATWTGASLLAFDRGLWLVMVQPILAIAVALFAGTAYRYFVEGAEKRKVSRLFGRFVSRDVYQQLMSNPALAELGGGRREMSVLFSDLRGFTSITEQGDPEDLVRQLNEYFSCMVDVVFRNGGTVDKFVGDMVMALFGAPLDDPSHADSAVTTAVEMVQELAQLNRRWVTEGRVQLDIGIGVNSGGMIAGNIGSSAIMAYTVIGDSVNLASRLESLNKDYRTRIIISAATRSRLEKSHDLRPLGGVVVKGKTQTVEIFEVISRSPLVPADEQLATVAGELEGKLS
jgi:adenylate cyclase